MNSTTRGVVRASCANKVDACQLRHNFATGSLEVEAAAPVAAAAATAVGEN